MHKHICNNTSDIRIYKRQSIKSAYRPLIADEMVLCPNIHKSKP